MSHVAAGQHPLAVVFTRESRAGTHCRNRMLEWQAAAMLFGSGLILCLYPKSIEGTAFHILLDAGFRQSWLGPFFLTFGGLRAVALFHNGGWPLWGPAIRGFGCCAGATLWFCLMFALFTYGTKTDAMPVGVAVYAVLLATEFVSVLRAAKDVHRSV